MKGTNVIFGSLALAVLLSVGLGCKSLTDAVANASNTAANASNASASNVANTTKAANSAADTAPSKVEKADFTMTSEELDKEYNKKGVKSEDLEKYSNKNIAVTGRVTMLVTEKKGTTQPWVTLFAPGLGNGVNCYFDDENVSQMSKLKEDKMVKIQGFQDDFIVPEVSPMLKHCVVLEGAN
jgi:hypothetical protein